VPDPAAPQEEGDPLGDLDDLLASRRLQEVELGTPFGRDREDEPQAGGVLTVVPGRLAVHPQVAQVLLEEDLGQQRLGLLHERSVRLDDLLVDLGIDADEVLVAPAGVQDDVATAGLDRRRHVRPGKPRQLFGLARHRRTSAKGSKSPPANSRPALP
jgi:hypothetical protein